MEIWLPALCDPGYEVSNQGRVQKAPLYDSLGRLAKQSQPVSQALTGPKKWGRYWEVRIWTPEGKLKRRLVHHMVCETFHGARPKGLKALHNDGNKQNNCETNLRWDTQASNIADMHRHRGGHHYALKTECLNGHDITDPENTYANARGRKCKRCQRARTAARYKGIADYRELL